jgi:hypothetical protein
MKKRGLTIKINLSNRWIYFLITLGILAIIGIGVYATTYTPSGAGHPYTEISTCGANQILKMNSAGDAWTCADDTSGGSSKWTTSGNNIYNSNTGNVGIGTSTPTKKLEIGGDMNVMGSICMGADCITSLGPLYGYCRTSYCPCMYGGCTPVKNPAYCNGNACACHSGYEKIQLSGEIYSCVLAR